MTKLGIIGAMEVEVRTLQEKMPGAQVVNRAGMEFWQGVLHGLAAVVVRCGVGKVNAGICAQILCDCFGVTHIVNTGIAGSLSAELDIGDIVVSRDAIHHDFTVAALGYPVGQVPGLDTLAFPADETLLTYAFDASEEVHPGHTRIGRVASGDQFVCTKAQKTSIVENTGALCTEMEGAAIAQAAYRNNVPYVVIRAISDKADETSEMDYPTFETIAAHRCAAVTEAMAKRLRADEAAKNEE